MFLDQLMKDKVRFIDILRRDFKVSSDCTNILLSSHALPKAK